MAVVLSLVTLLSPISPLVSLAAAEPLSVPDENLGIYENTENVEGVVRLIYGCTQGLYTSPVIDAGNVVHWDTLTWTESEPSLMENSLLTSEVKLQVRVSDDGSAWSEWMGPDVTSNTYFTTSPGDMSNIPAGRYIQYRAFLSSDGIELSGADGPKISDVVVNYTHTTDSQTPTENIAENTAADNFENMIFENENQVLTNMAWHGIESWSTTNGSENVLENLAPQNHRISPNAKRVGIGRIARGGRGVADFRAQNLPLKKVTITPRDGVDNVDVFAELLESWPEGVPLLVGKRIYAVMDISPTIPNDRISSADIEFDIPNGWMRVSSVIVAYHYNGSAWEELPTSRIGEDANEVHFSAQTPGFSIICFVDNSNEDFTQGTHENTENVDDAVRLISDYTQGRFTSRVIDAGQTVNWDNLVWTENEPSLMENTLLTSEVKLQVRVSSDNLSWSEWMGPDETPNTYFMTSPTGMENIQDSHYIQYRAYFWSETPALSGADGPTLREVIIVDSTYLINETFESSGTPTGWLNTGVDWITTRAHSPTHSDEIGAAADTLATSVLANPRTLTAYWWPTSTRTLSVKYSSSQSGPWTAVTGSPFTGTADTWNLLSVDLSSYSNIYIQFGSGGGIGNIDLDDVKVTERATHFHVTTSGSGTETAGTSFSTTLTAVDSGDATDTGYAGSKSITWTWTATNSPGGNSPTKPANGNVTFTNGVATVAGFTLTNAGETPTITANDGTINGTSSAIMVNPGALNDFTVVPSTYSPTTDDAFTVTLTARDAYQNTKTNYTGNKNVAWAWASGGSNAPDSTPAEKPNDGNQNFSSGQVSGISGFHLYKVETATIQATADTKSGTSSTITVGPGALSAFTMTGYPSSCTINFAWLTPTNDVVVTAQDAYQNTKTSYTGQVYFTSSDGSAVLPYTEGSKYTFVGGDSGQHTFEGSGFTLNTEGNQTITVTDGDISKESSSISVTPVSWRAVESWSGNVSTTASAWRTIESWSGDVNTIANAWTAIERWSGDVSTVASAWYAVESWSGTVEAPYVWGIIEGWTGTVAAPAVWVSVESWSGDVSVPSSAWQAIESWNGDVGTVASAWTAVEGWSGDVSAPAVWINAESWVNTVTAPAVWICVESWSETVGVPSSGWNVVESWSGTISVPSSG
jgi:PGF-pre-PGF domain-containing protein